MKAGRPPQPKPQAPRTQRPQLKVRIPSHLRNEIRNHLKAHRRPGLTQDRLVASALAAFLHKAAPDEVLYSRLARMSLQQEEIAARVEMLGLVLTEYLSSWFRLWPELSPDEKPRRRGAASEMLTKYLSSLHRAVTAETPESLDLLDPEAIAHFLRANRRQTET